MPVMDEFKAEREALKNGTPKQKFEYFMDYYKWYVIVGVIVLILIITFVYQKLTEKDAAFNACFFNSAKIDVLDERAPSIDAFVEYAGIDTKDYDAFFDTSISIGINGGDDVMSAQKLMVYIAAAEYDVMVSDSSSIQKYAYQQTFYDLRTFLSTEQLEQYQDSLYYIEGENARRIANEEFSLDFDFTTLYKDPFHPEDMNDPIPVGICIGAESPILKDYVFLNDTVIVAPFVNTKRPELAIKFIEYAVR